MSPLLWERPRKPVTYSDVVWACLLGIAWGAGVACLCIKRGDMATGWALVWQLRYGALAAVPMFLLMFGLPEKKGK